MVMKPSPPTNIIARMNTCPVIVQYVAVSWITSPVTVAAEVAVKSASTKGANPEPLCEKGIRSRAVPMLIRPRNA